MFDYQRTIWGNSNVVVVFTVPSRVSWDASIGVDHVSMIEPAWDSKEATTMIGQMVKLTIDDRRGIPQFNEDGDFFGLTHQDFMALA